MRYTPALRPYTGEARNAPQPCGEQDLNGKKAASALRRLLFII